MTIFGLDTKSKFSRIGNAAKKAYRYFIVLTLVCGTVYSGYLAVIISKLNVKVIEILCVVFFGSSLGMMITSCQRLSQAISFLYPVVSGLPQKDIKSLRLKDAGNVLFSMLLVCVSVSGMGYYMFSRSTEAQFFLREVFGGRFEGLLLQTSSVAFSYGFLMASGHFYWIALSIASIYASNTKSTILLITARESPQIKSKTIPLSSTQIYRVKHVLEKYFYLVHNVNTFLGCIPFSMFALLFTNILFCVSLLSFNNNLSIGFIFVFLGSALFSQIQSIMLVVREASKAKKTIKEALALANTLSTEPVTMVTSFDILEARRSLTVYLQQQDFPNFTACNIFDIEPSVVLTFLNSVIPFTVMMITAIAGEVNKRNIKS